MPISRNIIKKAVLYLVPYQKTILHTAINNNPCLRPSQSLPKAGIWVISHLTWEWMVEATLSCSLSRPKVYGWPCQKQGQTRDAKETKKQVFRAKSVCIFNRKNHRLQNEGWRYTDTLHFNVRVITGKIGKTWITKRYVLHNDWLLYSQICNFTPIYKQKNASCWQTTRGYEFIRCLFEFWHYLVILKFRLISCTKKNR